MEYRLRRFDGEYRWLLDRGAPRFASNGDFVGFIGSCIDISDRKIALSLNQAIPCGLIVNELITNALKHVFKSDLNPAEPAELRVHLVQTSDHQIQLSVGNSGNTLPPNFNPYKAHSMGLQLVTNLVDQLEGNLTVERGDRTLFIITFDPIPEEHDETS